MGLHTIRELYGASLACNVRGFTDLVRGQRLNRSFHDYREVTIVAGLRPTRYLGDR